MIRHLIGEALIAAGEKIRGGLPNLAPSPWADTRHLIEENYQRFTATAGWTAPAPLAHYGDDDDDDVSVPTFQVQSALCQTSDADLLGCAATIIEGWTPLLLRESVQSATDVDLFVQALRDRAAQFRAIDRDEAEAALGPDHLIRTIQQFDPTK